MIAVEKAFGIEIADAEARQMETVGSMWAFVVEHTGASTGAQMDDAYERLLDIIAEELGVERSRLTPDIRFVADLGID